MHDFPNMGERERGKPDASANSSSSTTTTTSTAPVPAPASTTIVNIASSFRAQSQHNHEEAARASTSSTAATPTANAPGDSVKPPVVPGAPQPAGWTTTWRHFFYEKWRLCAFIALAVMVSRFTTRTWAWVYRIWTMYAREDPSLRKTLFLGHEG